MRPEPDNPMPSAANNEPDGKALQEFFSFEGPDLETVMLRATRHMKQYVVESSDCGWNRVFMEVTFDEDALPPTFYVSYTGKTREFT
jgi:hypothetical protein